MEVKHDSPPEYSPAPGYYNQGMTAPSPPPVVTQQPAYTNIVINQSASVNSLPQRRMWQTQLCACMEDCESCCCTYWFGPCYLGCVIAPIMGESCCDLCCLPMAGQSPLLVYRTKLRARYNIDGSAIDDCCKVVFCGPCVQCQLKRELNIIGKQGSPPF